MANNGIYYSSGNTLNFTTNNTTWMNLSSGGTLTVNNIDFDTTPNVPAPTGGTLYFDSNENALSYKPITNNNDVTVNLGQESLIRIYNNLGFQITNGQALHITGATSGTATVSLAVGTGGDAVQFQISGIATHDIPDSSFGFMTEFGVVRDINLTGFTVGEQVYLSQTVPGAFASYSELSFTGRTCEVGHVLDNSASGKIQVTILNEIEGTIITTQENNILAANNSSTGVFQFSGLSITTPSGTTFNVGAVEGWIIDNVTAPANPTIQLIIYPGSTGNTATYVTSDTETYILLTSGLTIIQQTTFPTPQQRRQNLYLGKFGHGNRQFLINAFNEPDSSLSPLSQLRDMFTAVKLVNDGVLASANGANLNINTSAGVLYGLGIGYVTNKLNPNSLTINSQSPATFQYRTQTGGTAVNTTLIDPLNYDVGGVITALTGTKATNQRIYLLQNGQIRVQYGQQDYNQLAAAVAALQNETFVTFPNFRDNGILIGILSVLSTCTDLTDTSKAQFFSVSKFGELIGAAGGTSTTTLQQAYNNSADPEITINSTLDGVSIKNGTGNADNVSQLLQGVNSGGTVTSFIRADGAFSGTSIFGTGLTATTVSATTYLNLPQSVSGGGITNYIPVWTGSTGLGNSIIQSNGSEIGVGISPDPSYLAWFYTTGTTGLLSNATTYGIIGNAGSGGIGVQGNASGSGYGVQGINITSGGGGGWGVYGEGYNGIGVHGKSYGDTGPNIGVRGETDIESGGTPENIGGYFSAINGGTNYSVQLTDGTEGTNKVLVSQTSDGKANWSDSLTGLTSISATTYYNYPGSSSANCVTTFFVTNISGCSPVNILSPLNVTDGLTVTGTSTFTSGLSASTFSAGTYQNLPVSAVTSGTGISASTSNGVVTVSNTDLGSSQNIFKNIQIEGVNQFSAGSNSSDLNFSGINITITSASTNTLVFSAGTGGGGGVTSLTAGSGLSGNSTTGAITLINTQVQGITGVTAGDGITVSTVDNVSTITNGIGVAVMTTQNVENQTTTLVNLPELTFSVLSGSTYRFRFVIHYEAFNTATGSRFTLSGAATTFLSYRSMYSLGAGTQTLNPALSAYNQPAASNTSSTATAGNIAIVEGILKASEDGSVVGRFASEAPIAGAFIRAMIGSYVEYQKIA
jgi:hypothetical protein